MSRSILSTIFLVFLVTMNTHQALGLAGVLNRVRTTGILGWRVNAARVRNPTSLLPAQVVTAKEASGDEPAPQPEPIFDADSYRQEMTNLVYERNFQRMTGY